jgi:guanyl-specific ribonuclease Sa
MALVFLLLFAGKAFGEDDWSRVYRENQAAYPKDADLKEVLALAEGSGTPAEEVSAVLARSAAASVSAQDFGAFIGHLTAARKAGLPSHPFAEKILEGLSKNVPPHLILAALDRQREVYREAQTIVGAISGGGPGEEAIDSVALAIQRGVSPTALRELYHDVSPGAEVIFHSAQAMADLKDLGFSESQGRRMVEAAVNAGYFTHEEPLFTAVVSKARKSGLSNDEIADKLEAGLRQGYPLFKVFQPSSGSPSLWKRNTGMWPGTSGGTRSGRTGGAASPARRGSGRR